MRKHWEGKFQLGSFGTWPFTVRYGERLQHPMFLENGPFASERILALSFQLCPSPLVPWYGETLVLGVIEVPILSSMNALAKCWFLLLSLKNKPLSC